MKIFRSISLTAVFAVHGDILISGPSQQLQGLPPVQAVILTLFLAISLASARVGSTRGLVEAIV